MILPLLSPVLLQMQRLRRCAIAGTHEGEFDFSKYDFDRSRDCLVDELTIHVKGIAAVDALGLNADSDSTDGRPTNIFRVHGPPMSHRSFLCTSPCPQSRLRDS